MRWLTLLMMMLGPPAAGQEARPLLGPGTLGPPREAVSAPSQSLQGSAPQPVVVPLQAPPSEAPPPRRPRAPATPISAPADQCGPAREGALACMAGRACVCRFERGGQLIGRPDRFVWDCGPLRPDCPPAQQPQQGGLPPELQLLLPPPNRLPRY